MAEKLTSFDFSVIMHANSAEWAIILPLQSKKMNFSATGWRFYHTLRCLTARDVSAA